MSSPGGVPAAGRPTSPQPSPCSPPPADISPAVREDGFELLRNVIDAQRWGAADPPAALHGWSALVKTGQFVQPQEGLRFNSAAIWLDAVGHPRYIVAIMAAEQTEWGVTFAAPGPDRRRDRHSNRRPRNGRRIAA